jgi:hypothetical protein
MGGQARFDAAAHGLVELVIEIGDRYYGTDDAEYHSPFEEKPAEVD